MEATDVIARTRAWLPHLAAVAFILLAAALVVQLRAQAGRISTQSARSASQQAAIDRLAGGLATAEAQLKQHGINPSVPPPQQIIREVAGPGPSDAQVQAAVDTYLALHPPAASVNTGQLATVVASYLTAHPPAPGPPPSDTQVSSAVAAYMAAHPAPSGPPGPPGVGEQGPPGPAGTPGSPPAGWSWTDPSGVTYDCVMDGQQPGPHYTCTARATPSDSASPGPPVTPSQSPAAQQTAPPASPTPTGTAGAAASSAPTPPLSNVSVAVFLQPLTAPVTPHPPPGPRSGLLLLAPSYLPLGRRHG